MSRDKSQVFKFKSFEVDQTDCAMKINTDGVLLGAMVQHESPNSILDIGTGTGVIALMLAQRFPEAQIYAIEIDEQASLTASKNFKNSKFNNRLTCAHTSIENFETKDKYDLIVSNPPYFINDLKNEEQRKGLARHASIEFFEMLVAKSALNLKPFGKIYFILPVKQANMVIETAKKYSLNICEIINLHSDKNKETFRVIICLSFEINILEESDFYIYKSLKEHTDEYKKLLKPFFLAF
ncbi:methyltransferase [Pedobacter aquatilis]|uniref:tRNA1(Val) (adenine(37)-N6)-methyltransferase n=1 Tax=Pedobacter aquatilis TaxID=351343 RepID=UPI0025B32C2A|nr:methyltransferase [Pedobacter aquatilis]MDN3587602.1 methyltransferase [Pedobacter aquatilis]